MTKHSLKIHPQYYAAVADGSKTFEKYLRYDPEVGKIYWKISKNSRARVGMEAGSIKQTGYRSLNLDGKCYFVHRIIWFFEHKEWPTIIDHIDGNGLNNKISNLRNVSDRDNQNNTHRHRKGKLVGTTFEKSSNKWIGQLNLKGKVIKIGRFKTEKEAHNAYVKTRIKYDV